MKTLFKYFSYHFSLFTFHFLLSFSAFADNDLSALDNFLNGLNSLQAGFEQTLVNERGEKLETSSGMVYLQRPGRFHWDYREPYSQKIITDGKTLWLFDEDLEQVTIREISESMDKTPAAVLSGEEDIEKHFVAINMGTIEGHEWIELTPRNVDNQYRSIRIGFEGNRIGMMILHDNLGQVTRIDFVNPRRNVNLDDSLFTFEPPEGIDVIDSRKPG